MPSPSPFPRSTALAACLCAAALAGCTTTKSDSPQKPGFVAAEIQDAVRRVETHLASLARIEGARTPAAAVPTPILPQSVLPEHKVPVTMPNWTGRIEEALTTLASRVGYRLQPHRVPPPAPIMVTIHADNTPWVEVVQTVGVQARDRALVRVNPNTQVIELHYLSPSP